MKLLKFHRCKRGEKPSDFISLPCSPISSMILWGILQWAKRSCIWLHIILNSIKNWRLQILYCILSIPFLQVSCLVLPPPPPVALLYTYFGEHKWRTRGRGKGETGSGCCWCIAFACFASSRNGLLFSMESPWKVTGTEIIEACSFCWCIRCDHRWS